MRSTIVKRLRREMEETKIPMRQRGWRDLKRMYNATPRAERSRFNVREAVLALRRRDVMRYYHSLSPEKKLEFVKKYGSKDEGNIGRNVGRDGNYRPGD